MRPNAFEWSRPRRLDEALRLVAAGWTPLAGGQSLVAAMRLRQAEPAALVDLSLVGELDDGIEFGADTLTIGARATHRALLEDARIAAAAPWLSEAARALGDVQVRNLGTVVGNLCWADPRANMAVALLASDAVVIAADSEGARTRLPLEAFFTGFRRHALGKRLALAVELPRPHEARGTYLEFSRQRQDLALVNVCAVLQGGTLRVAVGGIDPVPVRLGAVEAQGSAGIEQALDPARHAPIEDQHGDARYKLHLAAVLTRRALDAIGASPL